MECSLVFLMIMYLQLSCFIIIGGALGTSKTFVVIMFDIFTPAFMHYYDNHSNQNDWYTFKIETPGSSKRIPV